MTPWSLEQVLCGTCPICQGGNRRVRCERMDDGRVELFALCDECEALWIDPSPTADYYFTDAIEPLCPRSGEPLYGPHSWWATREWVRDTPWAIYLSENNAALHPDPPLDPPFDPSLDPPASPPETLG
jgi:hypothetical protein